MIRYCLFAPCFILGFILAACGSPQTQTAFISVTTAGNPDGPDVVMIPGLSGDPSVWDSAVEAYGGDYSIHLVAIRGFASTPAPDGAPVPTDIIDVFAEQVADYLRNDVPSKAVVMGHSMGGLTSLNIAARAPDEVSGVIIVDSLPFVAAYLAPRITPDAVDHLSQALQDTFIGHTPETYRAQQEFFLKGSIADKPYRRGLTEGSLASDSQVVGQGYYDLMSADGRKFVPKITAPIAVMYAVTGTNPMRQSLFEQQFSGAQQDVMFLPIQDSGHHIMYDQPERFLAALGAALGRITGR